MRKKPLHLLIRRRPLCLRSRCSIQAALTRVSHGGRHGPASKHLGRPGANHRVPTGPDWLHEIKHDGYRLIIQREGNPRRCPFHCIRHI